MTKLKTALLLVITAVVFGFGGYYWGVMQTTTRVLEGLK